MRRSQPCDHPVESKGSSSSKAPEGLCGQRTEGALQSLRMALLSHLLKLALGTRISHCPSGLGSSEPLRGKERENESERARASYQKMAEIGSRSIILGCQECGQTLPGFLGNIIAIPFHDCCQNLTGLAAAILVQSLHSQSFLSTYQASRLVTVSVEKEDVSDHHHFFSSAC